MIEIVGYWACVTVMSLFILSPVFYVTPWVIDYLVTSITEDKALGRAARHKIYVQDGKLSKDSFAVFGKFQLSEKWFVWICAASLIVSFFGHMIYGISFIVPARDAIHGMSYLDLITAPSELLAGPVSYITIAVILYFLTIRSLRKGYKAYVQISTLLAKAAK